MLRRPPRSTLFPYHDALPIWPRNRLAGLDGDSAARELFDAPRRAIRLEGNALDPGRGVSGHGFRRWIEVNDLDIGIAGRYASAGEARIGRQRPSRRELQGVG